MIARDVFARFRWEKNNFNWSHWIFIRDSWKWTRSFFALLTVLRRRNGASCDLILYRGKVTCKKGKKQAGWNVHYKWMINNVEQGSWYQRKKVHKPVKYVAVCNSEWFMPINWISSEKRLTCVRFSSDTKIVRKCRGQCTSMNSLENASQFFSNNFRAFMYCPLRVPVWG